MPEGGVKFNVGINEAEIILYAELEKVGIIGSVEAGTSSIQIAT